LCPLDLETPLGESVGVGGAGVNAGTTDGMCRNYEPIYSPAVWLVSGLTTSLTDRSGNGRNLTNVVDAPDLGDGPDLASIAMFDQKARLPVGAANAPFRTAGAVSMQALIKFGDLVSGSGYWIWGCEDGTAFWATWWKFGVLLTGGRYVVQIDWDRNSAGNYRTIDVHDLVSDGGWHVVSAQRLSDAGMLAVAIDGISAGTVQGGGAATGGANAYLFFGQDHWNQATPCRTPVSACWLSALSGTQIRQIARRWLGE